MNVKKIEVGRNLIHFTTNCYLLSENSECIIIDPADEYEKIISVIIKHQLQPQAIIITHCHIDHIKDTFPLAEYFGLTTFISNEEKDLLNNDQYNLSSFLNIPFKPVKNIEYLSDNDIVRLGNKTLKIIGTPGHTSGSISVIGDGFVISGDTLFFESIGRTDLPTGNLDLLLESIKNKLLILPDNYIVYPGHMQETTIGHEKKYNSFLE